MYLELTIVAALLNDTTNPVADVEQHCLIENTIYESIGENKLGMQKVTEVVLNRLDKGYRGAETFCDVVYSPSQFSWTLTPEEERLVYTEEEYLEAAQVVLSVIYNEVPRTLGKDVLHYMNPRDATDYSWYDSSKVVAVYGNHHFLANIN